MPIKYVPILHRCSLIRCSVTCAQLYLYVEKCQRQPKSKCGLVLYNTCVYAYAILNEMHSICTQLPNTPYLHRNIVLKFFECFCTCECILLLQQQRKQKSTHVCKITELPSDDQWHLVRENWNCNANRTVYKVHIATK